MEDLFDMTEEEKSAQCEYISECMEEGVCEIREDDEWEIR